MQKLGGLDAMFLYSETTSAPMHVAGLMYLELPEGKKADDFHRELRDMLLARIHLVPYLTHKLVPTPMDLDHPVWVKDLSFDIDQHLFKVDAPANASHDDIEALAARLFEPLMDRSKPLWEMWVIGDLPGNQVALFQKTHHAAIDGVSSLKAAELIFDFTPQPRAVEPAPADFWQAPEHTPAELWNHALENLTRYWWESTTRTMSMIETMSNVWQREMEAFMRTPAERMQAELAARTQNATPVDAPKTRLNNAIDANRAFSILPMSLPAMKQTAKYHGVKLNDLVLGIFGEGLRRYLAEHGEETNEALIASCPVSLHKPGDTSIKNQVASINVTMANHIEDLVERLAVIHQSANRAKSTLSDFREVVPTDFGAPGLPAMLQQLAQATQSGEMLNYVARVPMNLVVSNVAGFQQTMYVAGARLIEQMPMSIVTHGAGVNLTVTSYLDRLDLGITAASKVIPDLPVLKACIQQAYEDYLATVPAQAAPLKQAA